MNEAFNATWMYLYVGVALLLVAAQNYIFMKKASQHAYEIGLNKSMIRNAITTGVSISIIPTIPVIVVFLSLMPLLGGPLPWLRLSVIGSAHYEAFAAAQGIQSVGETAALGAVSMKGWVAAAWVTTTGAFTCTLITIIFCRPIQMVYEQAEKYDFGLVMTIGTGCMLGIMGFCTVNFGLKDMSKSAPVFAISFVAGILLVLLKNKMKEWKWLGEFQLAIAMLIGMAGACILFQ